MWIFTEVADAYDVSKREAQQTLSDLSAEYASGDTLPDAIKRAGFAFGYALAEFPAQTIFSAMRVGDGVKSGTAEGVVVDMFRALDVVGFTKAAKAPAKVAGRILLPGLKKSAQAAEQQLKLVLLKQLTQNVKTVVRNNRVYGRAGDLFRANKTALARAASGTAKGISGFLQDLGLVNPMRRIYATDWKGLVNSFPNVGAFHTQGGGALLTDLVVSSASAGVRHRRLVLVYRNAAGRIVVRGDLRTYSSLDEYRIAECARDAKISIIGSRVAEGVRMDYSALHTGLDIFVLVEGLVISNYDAVYKTLLENGFVNGD